MANKTIDEQVLQIQNYTYPNGFAAKQVVFRGQIIGSFTEQDGGFLPWGKRKPRESVFAAVLDIIADHQKAAQKQADFFQSARDKAFECQSELKRKPE